LLEEILPVLWSGLLFEELLSGGLGNLLALLGSGHHILPLLRSLLALFGLLVLGSIITVALRCLVGWLLGGLFALSLLAV